MVEQTVLPFKLDETKDSIISHAGPGLFGEFACGLNFSEAVDSELPVKLFTTATVSGLRFGRYWLGLFHDIRSWTCAFSLG